MLQPSLPNLPRQLLGWVRVGNQCFSKAADQVGSVGVVWMYLAPLYRTFGQPTCWAGEEEEYDRMNDSSILVECHGLWCYLYCRIARQEVTDECQPSYWLYQEVKEFKVKLNFHSICWYNMIDKTRSL